MVAIIDRMFICTAILIIATSCRPEDKTNKESSMPKHSNRLESEKSPYLLQHANNPVEWYPWGDEAFELARKEDKPIFLSVGYAACHWCHVMEHESFENEEIAALMNDAFVCVKVDREERPDIDSVYMTVCQMMTGSGGWPLTIIMTPDAKPFFAATYIPPDNRHGRTGMEQLIPRITDAWNNRRAEVLTSAEQITSVLSAEMTNENSGTPDDKVLERGYNELMNIYDSEHGGFGRAPKFPTPHRLIYLLRTGDPAAIKAVEHTLKEMRMGGVYDHVGYGFHRYSTDTEWKVPHFEKMLYDQALLTLAYTEAYQLTRNPFYKRVAQEIIEYVLRDLTSLDGAFYSSEDADSEGEEGTFYLWSDEELKTVLNGEEYKLVSKIWNVETEGNFKDEATRQKTGKNILYFSEEISDDERAKLTAIREKLFAKREQRIHPMKDTKVLADWNGLMIAALAKSGRVFEKVEYIQSAEKAARFVQSEMNKSDAELWHRWADGEVKVDGQLTDYAFFIQALIELYEATFKTEHLASSVKYNKVLQTKFSDEKNGAYYSTAKDAHKLIVRPKEFYDGAVPSGNTVQLLNELRLAKLTGQKEISDNAYKLEPVITHALSKYPSSFAQGLIALQFSKNKGAEIVIVGKQESNVTTDAIAAINNSYISGASIIFKDISEKSDSLSSIVPFTKELKMVDEKTTVYICQNFTCEAPITSLEELAGRLKTIGQTRITEE